MNNSFQYDALVEFGAAVLRAHDVPAEDATLVADSLTIAERWGHASHGLLRLPWYVERLRSGAMNPVTHITIDTDRGAVVAADAHDGIGQIVADRMTTLAIAKARDHGVGVVGVRNSNHFGTAAYFTRRAAAQGFAAILTTNGSPAMAPWGGLDKVVGANPWSFATPDGLGDTAVVDIANTGVARGKIYAAQERGDNLPDGWALDRNGEPTTDPSAALDDGIVLPMGGHKGYAISFMMDVFSGVLTGSAYGTGVHGPWESTPRSGSGHLVIVIDIRAFQPLERFEERMRDLVGQVQSVRKGPGVQQIFYPGEIENGKAAAAGLIDLPETTIAGLQDLAAQTDNEFPAPS